MGTPRATSPPVFVSVRPMVLARIIAVQFLADPDTDEVFAKIKVQSVDGSTPVPSPSPTPTPAAARPDAKCEAGFTVLRSCGDSIFPALDRDLDKLAQNILVEDVHGVGYIFRRIFYGKPLHRRLTTGWNKFVKEKKLVAGDSLVFIRHSDPASKIYVRIRRTMRPGPSIGGMLSPVSNTAKLASDGKEFEVTHYPKAGRVELVVGNSTAAVLAIFI